VRRGGIEGEVVYIDRFGNAITNLENGLWLGAVGVSCEIYGRRRRICPVKTFYQAVAPKTPVALVGSSGFLEIAIHGGNAEKALGVRVGTRVVLHL
jgi:S-adenosylmethionine hydrolase